MADTILPGITVTPVSPYDEIARRQQEQQLQDAYAQITSQFWPVADPGYVPPPAAAPVSPVETVIVDEETGDLAEIVVEADYVPVEALYDYELLELGTDSAYSELDRRQELYDAGEYTFAPNAAPVVQQFRTPITGRRGARPGYQRPRPLPGSKVPRLPPPAELVPAPAGMLGTLLTGLFALVFPQPMGPRRWDEAPDPVEFFPEGPRMDPQLDPITITAPKPILPGIEVYPYEFPEFDPGDRIRRIFPIGDYPGLLTTPGDFPGAPFPLSDPIPGPATTAQPDRTAPYPFGDPFPDEFGDPQPDTRAQPDIPPRIDAPPTIFDPLIPRIGDPVTPPRLTTPTAPPEFYIPPTTDLPPLPFYPGLDLPPGYFVPTDVPVQFDTFPFSADPPGPFDTSNCPPCKKEKKKKKKKKPRKVCYRGSYRELANGLVKKRLEEIPCEAKRAAPRRKPKQATRFPDLSFLGLP